MFCLTLFPVFLPLVFLCPPPASPRQEASGWTWTPAEEKKLSALERKAREIANGCFLLREGTWEVETPGSARLAAEISLYMEIVHATAQDLLGTKWKIDDQPRVKVFPSRAAYIERVKVNYKEADYRYFGTIEDRGFGITRAAVPLNHLYTYVDRPDTATFAKLDLAAIRSEGAKAVLIGEIGRQWTCVWLEEGVIAFFANYDLRADRKDALTKRRKSSPVIGALSRELPRGGEELPPLQSLLELDLKGFMNSREVSPLSNQAAAETLVDLLICDKRAKPLREAVFKEAVKAAGRGSSRCVLPPREVKRLEASWREHVKTLLAGSG